MKKSAIIAISALFCIAVPAVAQSTYSSQTQQAQDVQSDANAIHKDNAAIANDQANLQKNRMAKQVDKINGDSGKQAIDSTKIGANQAAISEKKSEKDVDQRILTHDQQQ